MAEFGKRVAGSLPANAYPVKTTAMPATIEPVETNSPELPPLLTLISTLVFAALVAFITYRFWRYTLGIPLELKIGGNIHIDAALPHRVRPWAPWYVAPMISALVAVPVWRWLVLRSGKINYWRCFRAVFMMQILGMAISQWCLDVGAILQYDPLPELSRVIQLIPAFIVAGFQMAGIQFMFGGFVVLPIFAALYAAALFGLIRILQRILPAS